MSFFVTPSAPGCFDTGPYAKSFVDILYNFGDFLENNDGFLGPNALDPSKSVAIIGAGPAGLCAAWLLMKMGLRPMILEAEGDPSSVTTRRVGGRVYSARPRSDGAVFEMGAMRVPRSERIFQYFADMYAMPHEDFPDPGKVDTVLYYENTAYPWKVGGNPPPIFDKVNTDWTNFVSQWLGPIVTLMAEGTPQAYAQAKTQWQGLVNGDTLINGAPAAWSTTSFLAALHQAIPDWGPEEFNLFGALGIGSGGFGPLYQVNFAEIARLVVNGLESCQQLYPGGLNALTNTKFWVDNPAIPSNIQTDGLCRGVYCLDYPNTNHGVVLLSYTWGDDSTKLIAVQDPTDRFAILLNSLKYVSQPFHAALSSEFIPDSIQLIDWQCEPNYYGAFKLNYPGQDALNQQTYQQFLTAADPAADTGLYLAGDSVGWCAGWIESALQTGTNCAAAVVQRLGGAGALYPNNPMTQTPDQYTYGA